MLVCVRAPQSALLGRPVGSPLVSEDTEDEEESSAARRRLGARDSNDTEPIVGYTVEDESYQEAAQKHHRDLSTQLRDGAEGALGGHRGGAWTPGMGGSARYLMVVRFHWELCVMRDNF